MTTNTDAKLAAKRPRKMAREPQAKETNPAPSKREPKIDIVLGLLNRAEGATIGQLVAATGWLPHTTRADRAQEEGPYDGQHQDRPYAALPDRWHSIVTSDNRIAALAKMSAAQKRAEWRRLTGQPAPPAFGSGLLTRAIAHAFQDKAAGSAGKALQRRLKQLGDRATRGEAANASLEVKPGTWLSRTWHGEVHQVVVLETGFEYRSERYRSLTAIALHITGAAWSGPRFFGLASPRLGKLDVTRGD